MTEISQEQMAALFGQQPRMSAEAEAHAGRVSKALYDAQLLAYAQVQFFGSILCDCAPRYVWGEPSPPQLGCVVHGHMQTDEHGTVLMFRVPDRW